VTLSPFKREIAKLRRRQEVEDGNETDVAGGRLNNVFCVWAVNENVVFKSQTAAHPLHTSHIAPAEQQKVGPLQEVSGDVAAG
jgi:hypothetical protein